MKTKNDALKFLYGIYCAALIIQNVLATKSIDIACFTVTTGIVISPIVFIVQDVTSEIFGFKEAKRMILTAYVMGFVMVLLSQMSIMLPASRTYVNQIAFASIFSTTARITAASFVAYMAGSLMNAKVMTLNKKKSNLFFRAISSTVIGQILDNALFAVFGFAGVLPTAAICSMVIGGTMFETIYEIIFFPITKITIKKLNQLSIQHSLRESRPPA